MAQLFQASGKVIEVRLNNTAVKAMSGSMVAYEGTVNFKSAGFGGGSGLLAGIKQRATGESLSLMECQGHGRVFLAVNAQHVAVIDLHDEQLRVESRQLLALAGNLQTNVTFAGLRGHPRARDCSPPWCRGAVRLRCCRRAVPSST